jgi:thymidylate synthase (FAD)
MSINLVLADIPKEDARYILPDATTSEIVISANLREYRHIFMVPCHPRAHWEIRQICLEMLRILKRETPIVFWNYEIDEAARCVNIMDELQRRLPHGGY